MAITHIFNNDADYSEGGFWKGDDGNKICEWEWNADCWVLTVCFGFRGRKRELSGFGVRQFTEELLKKRLPTLALEIAEDLRAAEQVL